MIDAVIVGAGPGGLGTAGLLNRLGLRPVVLERGVGPGDKWRRAYDRLQINTSRWTSFLPGMRFPWGVGTWPSRDALIDYYDAYVRAFDIDVRPGIRAGRVIPRNGHWTVESSEGEFQARSVVIATGRDCVPVLPKWPGAGSFNGTVMHVAEYRNATPYQGARVLVVGTGNSGSDVAVDLVEGGARSVWLAVRTPPHIVSRTVMGVPNDVIQALTRRLPTRWVDHLGEAVRRLKYSRLEERGLRRPPVGVQTYVRSLARVPTIDSGAFSSAVERGQILVVPEVARLDRQDVVFNDGSRRQVDVIVAATGYRPCLEPLVGHLGVLDRRGWPSWAPQTHDPRWPGLYVLGFGDPTRGNLRGLRQDARRVASAVRRRHGP